MKSRRVGWMIVAGLVAALGTAFAGAPEEGGPPAPPPPDARGGPEAKRPGGATGQPGDNLPAVRAEMQRYRKELKEIAAANLTLAQEVDNVLRQLREKGADEAELETAAKALAPQAHGLAEKQAAALATHYENLAKIFKPADEAAKKQLVTSLAEEILKRMSSATAAPQLPPWRMPGGPPPGWGPPRGGPPGAFDKEGGPEAGPRDVPGRRPGKGDKGGPGGF